MRIAIVAFAAGLLNLSCANESSGTSTTTHVEDGPAAAGSDAGSEPVEPAINGDDEREPDGSPPSGAPAPSPPELSPPEPSPPGLPMQPPMPSSSNPMRDAGVEAETPLDASGADATAGPLLHPLIADENGGVGLDTNDVGVDGVWLTYQQEGSVVTSNFEGNRACFSGTIASGNEWGARLALLMTFEGNSDSVWDGSTYSGFVFSAEITMSQPSAEVSIVVTMYDGDLGLNCHQRPIVPGSQSFTWNDLGPSELCPNDPSAPFDPSQIVHFNVIVDQLPEANNDFSVCISDLAVF